MSFGCIPWITFVTFFRNLNLVIFGLTSTKTFRHWVSCERNSYYSFSRILLKLCRCFCQDLKMCMQISFCYFFRSLNVHIVIFCSLLQKRLNTGYLMNANITFLSNFVSFGSASTKAYMDTGYLVNATPHAILLYIFETLQVVLSRSEDMHVI